MRMNLILISIIFLSSCKTMPLMDEPFEICGLYMEKFSEIDHEKYEFSYVGKCRCNMYEITLENIGMISESQDKPISYCNKSVVLKASSSWAKLRTWFEALIFWENQRQREGRKKLKKKFKKKFKKNKCDYSTNSK